MSPIFKKTSIFVKSKPALVASIGYGSMSSAISCNLRDSNASVIIGARKKTSVSAKKAINENFKVTGVPQAIKKADFILLAIPDLEIENFFNDNRSVSFENKCIILCHGLSFLYHSDAFPKGCDVILISPNVIADCLRANYKSKKKDYALTAILRDYSGMASEKLEMICEKMNITGGRAIKSGLREEVFSDLFAEQSLLVGGILSLIISSFETMREGGISDEAAYLSTFHEIKYIVDTLFNSGAKEFMAKVSDVALAGSLMAFFESGLTDNIKKEFKKIYKNITSGKFYRDFTALKKSGKNFRAVYKKHLDRINESGLCEAYEKFKPIAG